MTSTARAPAGAEGHHTVASLARLVGGAVHGDGERVIRDVADLASAGPEHLSFLVSPRYLDAFRRTRAGAVLVAAPLDDAPCALIACENPYRAMAVIAQALHPAPTPAPGIHPGAIVHLEAEIHPAAAVCAGAIVAAGARVGARSVLSSLVYVGEAAHIGEECVLHPGAKVLHRCVLGKRVILHAGAVIGSDGFGYVPDAQGRRHKIPQVGIVELGDDVEIGANATVDRATFGVTRIGAGTKIDNLVQVGHNVVIGRDCVLVSQSGIAGSTVLGDRVLVGPQAGTIDHVRVASDVRLAARTGVAQGIDTPGDYSGAPATEHRRWLRAVLATYTLPELRRTVKDIERRLARLEAGAGPPAPD